MRCRPRPGSRFYRLDRLLCRRGCWEPLYDLITPPLRRGRNARRRSGIRHVLAPPPPAPPSSSPVFLPLSRRGPPTTATPRPALSRLHLFLVFLHLEEATPPFSRSSPGDKMANTRRPAPPPRSCLRLQRAFTPRTKRDEKAEPARSRGCPAHRARGPHYFLSWSRRRNTKRKAHRKCRATAALLPRGDPHRGLLVTRPVKPTHQRIPQRDRARGE